ncbi:MAG: RES family NAD+ phosphorylase [Acidimicrobiales bacterium]
MAAPFEPELLDALEEAAVDDWQHDVWRQVLEGTPPLRTNNRGGRWNPPDCETLYASLEAEVAAAEIAYLLAQQPIPINRELVTYGLHVHLTRVVDLSQDAALGHLGLSTDDLESDDMVACQRIGDAAAWLGFGGLLVPSVRADGVNLVIFVNNMEPDDGIEEFGAFPYPPGPAQE